MLLVNELFAGVGSQAMALDRLGVEYKVVGIAEIDKYAIKSYEAIHGAVRNYGDISKVSHLDYADLWTYSFPCQDLSVAGKGRGIKEGTRSGLLLEVQRLLEVAEKSNTLPKYLLLENVKNLVGKKHRKDFDKWLEFLSMMGYTNYWQVLNGKDYGVPQNRERVFVMSIRGNHKPFVFPKGFDNGIRLKDILEDTVDESFFLSDEYHKRYIKSLTLEKYPFGNEYRVLGSTVGKGKGTNSRHWVYDIDSFMCTLSATMYKQPCQVLVKEATKQGYAVAEVGDSINLEQPNSKTRRGRVGKGVAQTLTCSCNQATLVNYRIRKLTPRETWRLMGFLDTDFCKAQAAGISNSQLYKQAGNSIIADVLYYLFKAMMDTVTEEEVKDNIPRIENQMCLF